VLLTVAVVVGNVLFEGVSENVLAFAAGAVLASLADTVMPDAYRQAVPWSPSPRLLASCPPS
jgi:zinc transporter, ZIP family